MGTLEDLAGELREFAREREWQQFHAPRSLLLALVGEVGELASLFQWVDDPAVSAWMARAGNSERAESEMADCLSYLLQLADVLHIDLEHSLREKIKANHERYPVDRSRGNALKYDALTRPGDAT